MRSALFVAAVAMIATSSTAQEQQAGNEASTNAEETFQQLIEQCDNTDVLVVRARIRLQIPRATEDAAAEAQQLLDQGLAECGGGDVDSALVTLQQSLDIASAGAAENMAAQAESANAPAATEAASEEAAPAAAAEAKPWWQFW